MGYNYYDNYSALVGSHYPTKKAKEQAEARYLADIELKKLEELKKIRKQAEQVSSINTVNYFDSYDIIDLECDIEYNEPEFIGKTKTEKIDCIKKQIKRHEIELEDYKQNLARMKRIETLKQELNDLNNEGFFSSFSRKGKLKKEIKHLLKIDNYYNMDETEWKSFKRDLANGVDIWTNKLKEDKEMLQKIKES